MIEKDFVTEGLKRTRIDEYLENELERAGYGGMEIQVTPLGTMVVVYAERPGMVIGRGGKTVRNITQNLKNNYELENPQVEVKEVDVPELNPKIMAHKIAAMLQRGMHFRRVAYTALRRIMGAGAQGVEVTISGKIRGSRSACAKFIDGYIKKCGEPSTRFVRTGFATVQLKPGVLGIYVRIMPPGTVLPDKVDIIMPTVEESPIENIVVSTEEEESPAEDVEVAEETVSDEIEDEISEETEDNLEDIEEEPEPKKVKETVKADTKKVKETVKPKAKEVKEAVKAETKKVEETVKPKAKEVKEAVKAETKKVEETVKPKAKEVKEAVKAETKKVKETVKPKAKEVKETVKADEKKKPEIKFKKFKTADLVKPAKKTK